MTHVRVLGRTQDRASERRQLPFIKVKHGKAISCKGETTSPPDTPIVSTRRHHFLGVPSFVHRLLRLQATFHRLRAYHPVMFAWVQPISTSDASLPIPSPSFSTLQYVCFSSPLHTPQAHLASAGAITPLSGPGSSRKRRCRVTAIVYIHSLRRDYKGIYLSFPWTQPSKLHLHRTAGLGERKTSRASLNAGKQTYVRRTKKERGQRRKVETKPRSLSSCLLITGRPGTIA